MICENLKTKDAQLIRLQNEVEYLREKVNDVEGYTSKVTNIFRNLPLLSNKDVTTDVIEFIRNVLRVEVTSGDIVACHELGKILDFNEPPPPIIAKVPYFGQKNEIWGRKKFLAGFVNPVNGKNVHMEERLTKADKILLDYAFEKGLRTQTNNSQPQVLTIVGEKVRQIKLNCKQDVDDYLKAGKCILRTEKTQVQSENFIPKKLFRFPGKYKSMDRPSPTSARKRTQIIPISDNDIIQQLRLMSFDSDKVMDYVKGLLSSSKDNSKKMQRNELQYDF